MPKMHNPLFSQSAKGAVAKMVIHATHRGRPVAKAWAAPSNPRTDLQTRVRDTYAAVLRSWSLLSPSDSLAWRLWADSLECPFNSPASPARIKPHLAFAACNHALSLAGWPPISLPPTAPPPLPVLSPAVSVAGAPPTFSFSWLTASPTRLYGAETNPNPSLDFSDPGPPISWAYWTSHPEASIISLSSDTPYSPPYCGRIQHILGATPFLRRVWTGTITQNYTYHLSIRYRPHSVTYARPEIKSTPDNVYLISTFVYGGTPNQWNYWETTFQSTPTGTALTCYLNGAPAATTVDYDDCFLRPCWDTYPLPASVLLDIWRAGPHSPGRFPSHSDFRHWTYGPPAWYPALPAPPNGEPNYYAFDDPTALPGTYTFKLRSLDTSTGLYSPFHSLPPVSV